VKLDNGRLRWSRRRVGAALGRVFDRRRSPELIHAEIEPIKREVADLWRRTDVCWDNRLTRQRFLAVAALEHD
jgi:hypothetical protein